MFQYCNHSEGYSLIELLITLGIVVVLATFSVLNFSHFQQNQDVGAMAKIVAGTLREARAYSLSQKLASANGGLWGVHFANNPSVAIEFQMNGAGCAFISGVAQQTAALKSGVMFQAFPSKGQDLCFDATSGALVPADASGFATIIVGLGGGGSSATIKVYNNGKIEY